MARLPRAPSVLLLVLGLLLGLLLGAAADPLCPAAGHRCTARRYSSRGRAALAGWRGRQGSEGAGGGRGWAREGAR